MINEILQHLKEFEPEYEVKLPLSEKLVSYKPFKIKDQKTLALVVQEKHIGTTLKKICEIVNNCSSEKHSENLQLCDLEYLFLAIRSKSVDEKIELIVGSEPPTKVAMNIENIILKQGSNKKNIFLNQNTYIELEAPKVKDYFEMSDVDNDLIASSVIKALVIDKKCYDLTLTKPKEIEKILNELSITNYKAINEFVKQIPTLTYTIDLQPEPIIVEGFLRFFT